MRIFKGFFLYLLSVVLVVVLASATLMVPWLHAPVDTHDQALRARLAGTIDTLLIGQSYTMNGVMPGVLDERLDTRTYNLSGSLMPIYGQRFMVEKELERNPVKHVILEITPDTFTTDEKKTNGNGDSYIFARLDSMGERLRYLISCVQPSDWPSIYARTLMLSMRYAAYRLLGRADMIDETNMGFNPQAVQDVTLDEDWAKAQQRSMGIFVDPIEENMRAYEEFIEMCKRSGCEVTIVYPLVSHAKVWQLYDQDAFLYWARGIAKKHDVPLFDFNLLRRRYELFSDQTSFSDDNHLSAEGAQIFSQVMADVIARHRAGEDVSPLFYESYQEVIRNSVYWR